MSHDAEAGNELEHKRVAAEERPTDSDELLEFLLTTSRLRH